MIERPKDNLTAADLWKLIIDSHPDISQVSVCNYAPGDHASPGLPPLNTQFKSLGVFKCNPRLELPIGDEKDIVSLQKDLYWELNNDCSKYFGCIGIIAIVGLGIAQMEKWEWDKSMESWEHIQDFKPEAEKSFLFVDFEIPCSDGAETMILETMGKMAISGWFLKSNGSYHFVGDELSPPEELPKRYGELILAFAGDNPQWEWARTIANGLIRAKEVGQVKQVAYYILATVGPWGMEGKRSFLIDLRHIAHSLLTKPTLRISAKEVDGQPPTVIARFKLGAKGNLL